MSKAATAFLIRALIVFPLPLLTMHGAAPVMQSFDPDEAVPIVVGGTINFLEAAVKEASVDRVVLNSSSAGASPP